MKKYIIAFVTALIFLGCGGGGGGSSDNRAQATTENGLKAYERMSVATYLPSLFTQLYSKISNNYQDGSSSCNGGGDITVKFHDIRFDDLQTKTGEYNFQSCTLNIDGYDVILNGKIFAYKINIDEEKISALSAFIKTGFNFSISGITNMTYKSSRLTANPMMLKPFNESGDGSFFTIYTAEDTSKLPAGMIDNFVRYNETKFGDIIFEGAFLKAVNLQSEIGVINGVYFTAAEDIMTNMFLPIDMGDYGEKLIIHVDQTHYFESGVYDPDDNEDLKNILVGNADTNVEIWQDASEAVHAKVGDDEEYSLTTLTPDFSFIGHW
jgi:hypothetical protein